MTRRALLVIFSGVVLMLLALALGDTLYYFLGLVLLLLAALGLLSALLAYFTFSINFQINEGTVMRGDELRLFITAKTRTPLPVAPFLVVYHVGDTLGDLTLPCALHPSSHTITVSARHVGQFKAGVRRVEISDIFGLFCFCKKSALDDSALVLPRPFEIDKPRFCIGDEGNAALSRTQEDNTSPEDTRTYLPGDALKRVHWKLSMRKQELLVRKYETPAPPDTLILMDCAAPEGDLSVEQRSAVRDALCETAVAVARLQMADQSPVRLPLYGQRANEFTADKAGSLLLLQEMLALQTFRHGEDFARVLRLEQRRMRRTGAAIIITTRLDAQIVDAVSAIRRMGPAARLYLVTYTPQDEALQPFVARLQHHLVEVCYVTPV